MYDLAVSDVTIAVVFHRGEIVIGECKMWSFKSDYSTVVVLGFVKAWGSKKS